ncbi:MAG TPA: hypothetical protein VMV56_02615 [Williamwhitmania sp.]|nr:hypothetical protein [Williamwhitmania sp.]
MKLILTTTLLYFSLFVFGQNIDSCGINSNANLTLHESEYLNDYLKDSRETFDFSGKKIIFVTYPSGNRIGTKSEYFSEIRKWNLENKDVVAAENNKKIATTLIVLTEKEKIESGGYDAILTYWVKFLTDNRRKKIIQQIKTSH